MACLSHVSIEQYLTTRTKYIKYSVARELSVKEVGLMSRAYARFLGKAAYGTISKHEKISTISNGIVHKKQMTISGFEAQCTSGICSTL